MIHRRIMLFFAATAIAALSGCATTLPSLKSSQREQFKGRPFVLERVSMSPNVTPKGDISGHCLPDSMYVAMLRHDLQLAFGNAELGKGTGKPVPVTLAITHRYFASNVGGLKATNLQADLTVGSQQLHKIPVFGGLGGFNWVGYWRVEQRAIPTMALVVANGLKSIQLGNSFNDQPHHFYGINPGAYWPYNDVPKRGLTYPMTAAEMERDTGKSASQLKQICEVRMES